jgi:hypothetical protein
MGRRSLASFWREGGNTNWLLATGYWQLYYEQVAMRILSTFAAEHALY